MFYPRYMGMLDTVSTGTVSDTLFRLDDIGTKFYDLAAGFLNYLGPQTSAFLDKVDRDEHDQSHAVRAGIPEDFKHHQLAIANWAALDVSMHDKIGEEIV
jgi:hypothetical protein